MPNIKSAKKRVKQSLVNEAKNNSERSRIATARRNFRNALDAGDTTAAESSYRVFCSTLDKAAKHGVIKKNTADRRKSRAVLAMQKTA